MKGKNALLSDDDDKSIEDDRHNNNNSESTGAPRRGRKLNGIAKPALLPGMKRKRGRPAKNEQFHHDSHN
jgi:AT hook motif